MLKSYIRYWNSIGERESVIEAIFAIFTYGSWSLAFIVVWFMFLSGDIPLISVLYGPFYITLPLWVIHIGMFFYWYFNNGEKK